jgi:hypothetical protein
MPTDLDVLPDQHPANGAEGHTDRVEQLLRQDPVWTEQISQVIMKFVLTV